MAKINLMRDFQRYLFTKELSERTVKIYCTVAGYLEDYLRGEYEITFADGDFQKIKGYMISGWATSIMDKKITTRALYITAQNVFLKYMYNMQYVDFDLSAALPPIPNIQKYNRLHPETITEKRDYSPDEIMQMMDSLNEDKFIGARNRAMIATLVMTGLRSSEMASMNISDMTPGFAKIARKGTHGNKVDVAIPTEVMPYIQSWLEVRKKRGLSAEPDDPLFISWNGNRLTYKLIHGTLSSIQKKLNLPTGVHTFRHTALTNIAKSANPAVARDVAGQKSIAVTNRYLHSTPEEKLEAVSKLSQLFA